MPEIKLVSWNLFHGRDHPPDRSLDGVLSKLLKVSRSNETYVQINTELLDEFAWVLSEGEWDVAMLQECPPRWSDELARRCDARAHRVLTSRNHLGALRGELARINPDLMGSWEGGSNLTLIRPRAGEVVQTRELVLHRGRPERRTMAFTRLSCGVCVANLHASTVRGLAREEVAEAGRRARLWAGRDRLAFGGDLNLRPEGNPTVFSALAESRLTGVTGPDAIDHILMDEGDRVAPTVSLDPAHREIERGDRLLRLSDHDLIETRMRAPVEVQPQPVS